MAGKTAKSVFDVSKPGKTAAPATSKPVITGNRAIIKDSVITANGTDIVAPALAKTDDKVQAKSRSSKTIQPSDELKADVKADIQDQQSVENYTNLESPGTEKDNAIVDELAEQVASKKTSGPSPEENAQAEKIQKLIDEKKYFVPISTPPAQRKGIIFGVLFFVLLVAVVTFYLLLDSKIISNNLKLPIEFFKDLPPVQIQPQPAPAPNPATTTEKPITKDTDSWLEFKGKNFSIRLADGWSILHQTDSEFDLIYSEKLTYTKGTKATITTTTGGRDGICCFIAAYDSKVRSLTDYSTYEASKMTLDSGQIINKFKTTITEEPDAIGPAKGSIVHIYILEGVKGDGLYFDYTIAPGSTSQLEIIEKVIKTAKLL